MSVLKEITPADYLPYVASTIKMYQPPVYDVSAGKKLTLNQFAKKLGSICVKEWQERWKVEKTFFTVKIVGAEKNLVPHIVQTLNYAFVNTIRAVVELDGEPEGDLYHFRIDEMPPEEHEPEIDNLFPEGGDSVVELCELQK